MINILCKIFTNKMLMSAAGSWLIAQILKTIIRLLVHHEFSLKQLFSDGGMPSGHSATVMALTTYALILHGADSPFFAISGVLAIIVMNDAAGVRREAGKHAERINELFDTLFSDKVSDSDKLKVLVGHTPIQVLMGALLGVTVGSIVCLCF